MRMMDDGEEDDKIIAVAENDPMYNHYNTLNDLSPSTKNIIKQFFSIYKSLDKSKKVEVGDIIEAEEAKKIVTNAVELYKEKFDELD